MKKSGHFHKLFDKLGFDKVFIKYAIYYLQSKK